MNVLHCFQNLRKCYTITLRGFKSEPLKPFEYYGFTYYPRDPNFKDPPYNPSKVFLVTRIKSMRGRNPEERKCLGLLNIDGEKELDLHRNIVKNIPEINKLLWQIKHLVKIKPIRWEGELPKDFSGTYLRDSGELVISPKLKLNKHSLKETEKYIEGSKKIKKKYWKSYLLSKWEKGYSGTI